MGQQIMTLVKYSLYYQLSPFHYCTPGMCERAHWLMLLRVGQVATVAAVQFLGKSSDLYHDND
jgi:hypothetical protein